MRNVPKATRVGSMEQLAAGKGSMCNDPGRYDVHRGGSRTSRQTPTHSTREALALALRKAARTHFIKEAVRATSFLPLAR